MVYTKLTRLLIVHINNIINFVPIEAEELILGFSLPPGVG